MGVIRAAAALHQMANLPFADLDVIAPGTSLILAPHPDDETLGCGGLIAAACEQGRPSVIVAVTDGTASHPGSATYPPVRLKALRESELRSAAALLGVGTDRVHFLQFPDSCAPVDGPDFGRAVENVTLLVRAYGVSTIFATWPHDPHGDHQATARLGSVAAQITGARLLLYPVWAWLLPADHLLPTAEILGARLDVGALLPRKRQAISAHASQYSGLITDDPSGFRLPEDLLAVFDRPFEVFLVA
jgi:LmbE family N-acetylglucosaminyl deacetylase